MSDQPPASPPPSPDLPAATGPAAPSAEPGAERSGDATDRREHPAAPSPARAGDRARDRGPAAAGSAAAFPFRIEFPPALPISARAQEITDAIAAHQVVVLCGETGSGKTTQLPKLCLAAGRGTRGRIACTQPRRVAALSVSRRVAEELGVEWGRAVGCKVRFDDRTSRDTVVKFMTDGMLLAEVQGDPLLRDYDTVIIDEAHERSLNIDFLLGHLRQLRYRRPDLKIVITSATIDTEAFSTAFDGAPIINVEGRTFPVEVIYAPLDRFGTDWGGENSDEHDAQLAPETDERAEALHYVDGAVEAVERIVRESPRGGGDGDILVFMPAERDIRETADLLDGRDLGAVEIVPLFGRLSNAEQQRVFAPSSRRKIIVATNIAETSLTITGIRYVVDTGLARTSRYSPAARTRRLPIEPVAQANCDQRKGRSGRVADGVCIRLYSEEDFLARPRFAQPEIQRANLADVILRLKAFGLGDVERFPFINPPAGKAIRAGYVLLEELGAIVQQRPEAGAQTSEVRSQESERRKEGDPDPASVVLASGLRPLASVPAWELTEIGHTLARLPVDPTVGRMILQARDEKCLREVLVIAAGLSIQDPRERPLEKQAAADAAHRRFAHPDSDFLTLLNIWEAFHDELEKMNSGRLRRFCRDHFLSFVRMREWRDIHQQLSETLRDRADVRPSSVWDGVRDQLRDTTQRLAWGTPGYRAIHRAILTGLLGNIALRDDERGGFKATQDRKVAIFPGSVLYQREERKKPGAAAGARPVPKKENKGPRWLMAAEIVETSRLYARTCARLDPQWVLDLGAHVLWVSHSEPFWNPDAGRVMVKQRTRLHGLELEVRGVGYGRIAPVAATEIFLREALVADAVTFPLDFLTHNRAVRAQLESLLTRTRDASVLNLDEAIFNFYAHHLLPPRDSDPNHPPTDFRVVSAVPELVDLVRERRSAGEKTFLQFEADDLRDPEALAHDAEAFPEALPLAQTALPLNYVYKPGEADDGVSLDVRLADVPALTPAALDWAVPGYLEQKIEHYLRALPKELRRAFVPVGEAAKKLLADVRLPSLGVTPPTLTAALATAIATRFQLRIDPAIWADKPPPEHLRVRVRVRDAEANELAASRDLADLRAQLAARSRAVSAEAPREEPSLWTAARTRWEKPESATWTFGDVPAVVEIGKQAGVPVLAYLGLQPGKAGVAVRLCRTPEEAAQLTRAGLSTLLELALSRELAWLERDLRDLRQVGVALSTFAPFAQLQADAFVSLRAWLLDPARVAGRAGTPLPAAEAALRAVAPGRGGAESTLTPTLTAAVFAAALDRARADLRGAIPRLIDTLRTIFEARQALLVHPTPYPKMGDDLAALLPADFLRTTPYPQLAHLARYLRGLKLRADRWKKDAVKDAERATQLARYVSAARALGRADPRTWLVEELRVSLFAQELGTAEKVSPERLDRALAEGPAATLASPAAVIASPAAAATPRPAPAPAEKPLLTVASVTPTKEKKAPLKNLTALDQLFRR